MVLPVSRASISAISVRRLLTISPALRKQRARSPGRGVRPGREGLCRGLDRKPRVIRSAGGDFGVHLTGIRFVNREDLSACRIAPCASSVVLKRANVRRVRQHDVQSVQLPLG